MVGEVLIPLSVENILPKNRNKRNDFSHKSSSLPWESSELMLSHLDALRGFLIMSIQFLPERTTLTCTCLGSVHSTSMHFGSASVSPSILEQRNFDVP